MRSSGFSLVELSIVLVIVGLLAGGIMVGSDMIRAAEIRSVITDLNKYKTAVYTFKNKYLALPGDMINATNFWGTASGGCPSGARSGTQTCNGNNDGTINCAYCGGGPTDIEVFLTWQHLANAGMIEGTYTGVPGAASSYEPLPGVNQPASKISGGTYTVQGFTSSNAIYFQTVSTKGMIMFGRPVTGSSAWGTLISPAEALNIDQKIDDGLPGKGSIFTMTPSILPDCTTSASADTSTYKTTINDRSCMLFLQLL